MKTARQITKDGLDISVFPPDVRDFIKGFAVGSGSQEAYVTSGVLACAAAMCDQHELTVKPGYNERSNFFLCIVGKPGVTKSAPIKSALKPLMAIEAKVNRKHKKAIDEWKSQLKEKGLKAPDRAAIMAAQPSRPPCKIVTDGSIEALILHLEAQYDGDQQPHCVYIKDELKGFFGGMDKYKSKGGDEYEMWLSLFSGSDLVKTLVSKTVFVEKARTTVIGGIQPEVYNECMGDKGDGMVDRFMIAIYEGDPEATDIRAFCSKETIHRYNEFMLFMGEQKRIEFSFWKDSNREGVLDLIQEFHEWCHKLGIQHDTGAFKKWEQQFYRLCIVFACMWEKTEIDVETVQRARDTAAFYAVDWLKAKIMSSVTDDDKHKTKIINHIDKKGSSKRRDLQILTRLPKKVIMAILQEMVEEGELKRVNKDGDFETKAVYELPVEDENGN
tara:strand:+ start:1094 stop:2422 length:1329 start_codon:yes stop_codon:yes gene_type:complete